MYPDSNSATPTDLSVGKQSPIFDAIDAQATLITELAETIMRVGKKLTPVTMNGVRDEKEPASGVTSPRNAESQLAGKIHDNNDRISSLIGKLSRMHGSIEL